MKKVKVEVKRGRTTSVLTLKWRAWCNIWLISWILCINGQRDTLGQDWRLPLTATVNFQHNQFMCSSIITICVLQSRQRIWRAMWFLSKKLRPRGRQVQLRHMEFKARCVGLAWDFLQVRLATNYVSLWLLNGNFFPFHMPHNIRKKNLKDRRYLADKSLWFYYKAAYSAQNHPYSPVWHSPLTRLCVMATSDTTTFLQQWCQNLTRNVSLAQLLIHLPEPATCATVMMQCKELLSPRHLLLMLYTTGH